ncbi:hypothetical protein Micbo1qcDRAFT_178566 [Microdochium bolleyi]|uniref:Tyrosinase copper-binding domain-containing protein n=1 Tax=Microdochium bolleyi TaxID=196109 RepID=A0A136IST3_9PEZI|nr:hypothetical protein Micbo1qcDRAFT_178566 [Microdochium bolleyi]
MKPVLIPFVAAASAAVLPTVSVNSAACVSPTKRVEWRELSAADQEGYIAAVKCLTTKPSRIGLEKSTLYDDFPYVHFQLSNYIHGGAPFLPWHRYFTHVYFEALAECGYTGPGTYWDWTQDSAGLRFSSVMSTDPKRGFGGDGSTSRTEPSPDPSGNGRALKCVDDGAFKDLRPYYLAVSPKLQVEGGHCLYRGMPEVSEPAAFEQMSKTSITPEAVAKVQNESGNWTVYHGTLEGSPHGVIHASLGGEMNPTTSPNEPLFFLHHAKIDQLWWQWQQMDPETRSEAYSGSGLHLGETTRREVSLDDLLPMGGIVPDIKVRDVIDISKSLCYTY